jgi:hypothetical protein
VESLSVDTDVANIRDYAELESAVNMTEVIICWREGHSIEEILPVLKRWRQLRRLTLRSCNESSVPRVKVICDFIMRMKYLTYLQLSLDCAQPETLRVEVNAVVLSRRPNFEFSAEPFQDE